MKYIKTYESFSELEVTNEELFGLFEKPTKFSIAEGKIKSFDKSGKLSDELKMDDKMMKLYNEMKSPGRKDLKNKYYESWKKAGVAQESLDACLKAWTYWSVKTEKWDNQAPIPAEVTYDDKNKSVEFKKLAMSQRSGGSITLA